MNHPVVIRSFDTFKVWYRYHVVPQYFDTDTIWPSASVEALYGVTHLIFQPEKIDAESCWIPNLQESRLRMAYTTQPNWNVLTPNTRTCKRVGFEWHTRLNLTGTS